MIHSFVHSSVISWVYFAQNLMQATVSCGWFFSDESSFVIILLYLFVSVHGIEWSFYFDMDIKNCNALHQWISCIKFCLLRIMFFSLYFPADSEDYYGCSGINCHDCWSLSRMTLKVFVVLLSLTWLIDSEASLASSTSIFNKNLYRCTVWCKQYKHPCKNITWQKEIWLDVLYRNPLENKVDGSVVSGGLKIHISLKIMFSSYLCMLGTGIVKSNTHLKLKWITKMVFFCN